MYFSKNLAIFTASSLNFSAALCAQTLLGLLAVYNDSLVLNANALLALGANKLNLACVDRTLGLNDRRGLALSSCLGVLGNDIRTGYDYLALFGRGRNYLALRTLGIAGDNNDSIIFFNMKLINCTFLL